MRRLAADNPLGFAALVLLAAFVLVALLSPLLMTHDPLATSIAERLQPPSVHHWFGTDQLGRDLFSRVVAATRLDLAIAVTAVALSCAVGTPVGAICGFAGGALDRWIGRVVDVLMAFPLFVVALAIVAALGNGIANIVYATAIINLPFYIRFARAEVAARRHVTYVDAARLTGAGPARLLFATLLPNVLPTLSVQVSLNLGWAVLNAAGLSFIGLGVRPPTPEWGVMTSEGAPFITTGQWWIAAFPGLALLVAVFAFNMAGDALRDVLDPRRRT